MTSWKPNSRHYSITNQSIVGLGQFSLSPINFSLIDGLLHAGQLSVDGVRIVLDYLVSKGNAEWLDKTKSRCQIHWRRPEEWAKLIYNWVWQHHEIRDCERITDCLLKAVENSFRNSVCTFYELTEGEDTETEPFHQLEREVLLRALKILQSEGRAEVLQSEEGVKFF